MSKNFAWVRTDKIKQLASLRGAATHNARTPGKQPEHADNHAAVFGGGSQLLAGSDDAYQAWHDRVAEVGIDPQRQRRDGVKAVEVCYFASRRWFDQASDEEREAWKTRSVQHARKLFGDDNLLAAHLHDDESTPHIHAVGVPLVCKERQKSGRRRKGREAPKKPQPAEWGLSAKDFIGGSKSQAQQLQTDYAASLADLGLRRGHPKRVTAAEHKSPTRYRAEQAEAAEGAKAAHERAETLAKHIDESAAAISLGYDAAEAGDFQLDSESQRLRARKSSERQVLPQEDDEVRAWRKRVAPLWSHLAAYARRLAKVGDREAAVERRESAVAEREHTLSEQREAAEKRATEVVADAQTVQSARERLRQAPDPALDAVAQKAPQKRTQPPPRGPRRGGPAEL